MPANIETFARMGGTEPAWHGLGGTWAVDATLEEKAEAAGMNWTVDSSPLIYKAGETAQVSRKHQVFFRSDRPSHVIGVQSDQFKPVQPMESLEFLDQMSQELDITIDTAGVLQGGNRYWALATHNGETEPLPGDKITDHLLVATANDGTMATRIGPTRVRVVCQNTLTAAISNNLAMLKINHRSKVNWNGIKTWLKNEHEDFAIFGDLMGELAQIPVTAAESVDFAKELMAPEWAKGKAPRKLTSFLDTLQHGVGQKEAGATVYGLLNGVTRHIDHERGKNDEKRLNSAWFGQGAAIKNQAMELLISNCVTKWGHRDQLVPVVSETKYKELLAA